MENKTIIEHAVEVEEQRKENAKKLAEKTMEELIEIRSQGVPFIERKILHDKINYCEKVINSKIEKYYDFEIWGDAGAEIKRIGWKNFVYCYKNLIYKTTC